MGQILKETHFLQLQANAPGTGVVQGTVVHAAVGRPAEVVVAHHGGEVALGLNGRQAL